LLFLVVVVVVVDSELIIRFYFTFLRCSYQLYTYVEVVVEVEVVVGVTYCLHKIFVQIYRGLLQAYPHSLWT